jgi:hypothetical protein
VPDRLAAPANVALHGLRQPGEQSQQAGFSGAVFPPNVQPLTRADQEVEPGKQAAVAAHAGQPMCTQHETKMEVNFDGDALTETAASFWGEA